MLVKLFNAILLSLCAMLFFVFIQEPYNINITTNQLEFRSVEASNLSGYVINNKLDYKIVASKYFKEGEKDVFIKAFLQDINSWLNSDIAYKENNFLYLKDNVVYENIDLKLNTNLLEYDLKNKILQSNSPTELFYKNYFIKSKYAKYNIQDENIVLKGVYLCIN